MGAIESYRVGGGPLGMPSSPTACSASFCVYLVHPLGTEMHSLLHNDMHSGVPYCTAQRALSHKLQARLHRLLLCLRLAHPVYLPCRLS